MYTVNKNDKVVLNANFTTPNVLKRQISTNSIAKEPRDSIKIGITQFLGFTRAFCSKSDWGSIQNVLMIVL